MVNNDFENYNLLYVIQNNVWSICLMMFAIYRVIHQAHLLPFSFNNIFF